MTHFISKIAVITLGLVSSISLLSAEAKKPNILWIYAEDTSPWMGCYGDKINKNHTPHIDGLAAEGVLFSRAFVPAPVCSVTRSAMITGLPAIRTNTHEHRSSRSPDHQIKLPEHVKPLPHIMREHGYSTHNYGKTDYNFIYPMEDIYTTLSSKKDIVNDFSSLKNQQPFFLQIQTSGGKTRTSQFNKKTNSIKSMMNGLPHTSPDEVTLPLDHPNNDVFKSVMAQHYDAIRSEDRLIGKILASLKASGMEDDTIVVYFSDHGAPHMIRFKQMCTEGGLHVPFIIKGPKKYISKSMRRNEMVNMLDLTATTLAWAGIPQPAWYEGQNLFSPDYQKQNFIASSKDRLDHTIDRVRTIRTERYRYVKNFFTDRIFLQPQYRDSKDYVKNLHAMYQNDELSDIHKNIYFGERPAEEFYDIIEDPAMINNLINQPKFSKEIKHHRRLLDQWLSKGDTGSINEPIAELIDNGEKKKWGTGVNPAYELYRQDSDGDGLSDIWEKANQRDPHDGLLNFEFDCGGHQTEGWDSQNISNNITGYLGYLDFQIEKGQSSLLRKGLNCSVHSQDKSLSIRYKSNQPVDADIFVNDKKLASITLNKANQFKEIATQLSSNIWKGTIHDIQIKFKAEQSSFIEIDHIKTIR